MNSSDGQSEKNERPCPKRPASESELGFTRRPMVRWFDPHQLLDTVSRVVASGLWNSYADSRELQGLVPADEIFDRSGSRELWFDYVADLGDGWRPTYTIAWLLAQERLEFDGPGESRTTERGRLLVMGGDQVYPVPKRRQYENRLIGPYRSVRPCADESTDLFVIPGSHDWYDGLINFTNLFCRGRWIGGWKTSQTRSYFALKLPHRWWIWGIDVQFGDHLDETQLRYFASMANEEVEPGDSIVVCMSKGVESGRDKTDVFSDRDLRYLEREVVEPAGARVALYLKSGRHYYCRYEEEEGSRQFIRAGGGGAFMHPTHNLPERADPGPETEEEPRFRKAAVYPSARQSKRLRKRVFLLPGYNLPLAGVFGIVQVLLAFMLNLHLRERHRDLGLGGLRKALWASPAAFLLLVLIVLTVGAMVRLAHDAPWVPRVLLGLIHSLGLFATLAGVLILSSRLSSDLGEGAVSLLAFLGLVALIGGVGGVLGIAAYLWLANCFGYHGNEAYAPLHHMDYKNFLRLHIGEDGTLTVYPIAVDRVGRKWELRPDDPAEAPWFAPVGEPPRPHLIEEPLRVAPTRSQPEPEPEPEPQPAEQDDEAARPRVGP